MDVSNKEPTNKTCNKEMLRKIIYFSFLYDSEEITGLEVLTCTLLLLCVQSWNLENPQTPETRTDSNLYTFHCLPDIAKASYTE